MSIILDALKKAQQERKQTTTKTTYTFKNPGQKPRWVVYGILIVVVACVLGYLYIPAFHKPKQLARVIVKPEPPKAKPVTIEAKKVEAKVESIEKAEPVKAPVKTEMAKPKEEIKVAIQKTEVVQKEVVEKKEVRTVAKKDKKVQPTVVAKRVRQKTHAPRKEPAPERQREDVSTAAVRVDNKKLDLIYNEALKETQMGRLNEAKRLYLSILAERPDHIEALNNLGVIATNEGNTKEALFYFKKILGYKKDYAKAYNNIGLIMMSEGDKKLAEEYFRKSIELDAESVEPYLNLSAHLRGKKRLQEASQFLETILQKGIKNPALYLSYAITKDEMGQTEEAIRYYRSYLSGGEGKKEERNKIIERLRVLEESQSTKNR